MCSGVTGLSCVDKYAEADGAKCAAGSLPQLVFLFLRSFQLSDNVPFFFRSSVVLPHLPTVTPLPPLLLLPPV